MSSSGSADDLTTQQSAVGPSGAQNAVEKEKHAEVNMATEKVEHDAQPNPSKIGRAHV